MNRPHFLCIGAQKAATTWLAHNLRQHPEIWLPPVKELHYFDADLRSRRQGESYRLGSGPPLIRSLRRDTPDGKRARRAFRLVQHRKASLRWARRYLMGHRTDHWYRSLFADAPGVTGEATPAYAILDEATVAYVAARLPDVRVIYLLRDPVERAWSAARMRTTKQSRTPIGTWPAADQVAYLREAAHTLLPHSDYPSILGRWERHIPPERLFTGFFKDIAEAPVALLTSVADFLGVDPDPDLVPPDARRPRNARALGREVPPECGRWLSERLAGTIEWAHARFDNAHTAGWMEAAARRLATPA